MPHPHWCGARYSNPMTGARAAGLTANWRKRSALQSGRRVFAPHLPRSVLSAAARADRLLRGDKARLTADRVGYMTHPNWVARSAMKVPETVWAPRIHGEEGLAATARWYRARVAP